MQAESADLGFSQSVPGFFPLFLLGAAAAWAVPWCWCRPLVISVWRVLECPVSVQHLKQPRRVPLVLMRRLPQPPPLLSPVVEAQFWC